VFPSVSKHNVKKRKCIDGNAVLDLEIFNTLVKEKRSHENTPSDFGFINNSQKEFQE
jgi:hypothetical protein